MKWLHRRCNEQIESLATSERNARLRADLFQRKCEPQAKLIESLKKSNAELMVRVEALKEKVAYYQKPQNLSIAHQIPREMWDEIDWEALGIPRPE